MLYDFFFFFFLMKAGVKTQVYTWPSKFSLLEPNCKCRNKKNAYEIRTAPQKQVLKLLNLFFKKGFHVLIWNHFILYIGLQAL